MNYNNLYSPLHGTRIVKKIPKGYHKLDGALTTPNGYILYGKGSRFDGTHKRVLKKLY